MLCSFCLWPPSVLRLYLPLLLLHPFLCVFFTCYRSSFTFLLYVYYRFFTLVRQLVICCLRLFSTKLLAYTYQNRLSLQSSPICVQFIYIFRTYIISIRSRFPFVYLNTFWHSVGGTVGRSLIESLLYTIVDEKDSWAKGREAVVWIWIDRNKCE